MGGWVNGSCYLKSNEKFGILPVCAQTQHRYELGPYNPKEPSPLQPSPPTQDQGSSTRADAGKPRVLKARPPRLRHRYLASQQQTRYPVLQIHNKVERRFFRKLVKESPSFANRATPDWASATVEWNRSADGVEVFYKVCSESPLSATPDFRKPLV